MHTFTFERVQGGYWGQTALRDKNGDLKRIQVKAPSVEEARAKVIARKDYWVRLGNGDHRTWLQVTA